MLVDPKRLSGFSSYFQHFHKWDVKNGFVYVLLFSSLISDGLGGVCSLFVEKLRNFYKMEVAKVNEMHTVV